MGGISACNTWGNFWEKPGQHSSASATLRWNYDAYIKAGNAEAGNEFGSVVAIDGDTLVVGVPYEDSSQTSVTNGTGSSADSSATDSGAAYVYKLMGGIWQQQAYLKASNAEAGDNFGQSIAISGNTIVVGASGEASNQTSVTHGGVSSTDNSAPGAGAAYVFVRDGAGNWSEEAYLKAANAEAGDSFGKSVAIAGDTIVVGAFGEDSNQTTITNGPTASANNAALTAGAAYVFVRSGNLWNEQAYLKAPNAEAADQFGETVALSGNTIVVGAQFEDSNQSSITNGSTASSNNAASAAGAAYVFIRSGVTWSPQAYLKPSNSQSADRFAYSIAISGDLVVVGAILEDSNETTITQGTGGGLDDSITNGGAAYVFRRSGSTWAQDAYLKPPNIATGALFGWSVAVSGEDVIVGARSEANAYNAIIYGTDLPTDNSQVDTGAAYFFTRRNTMWELTAYIKAPNANAGDFFGNSVAIAENVIAIGALGEASSETSITNGTTASADNSSASAGAVYVIRNKEY